LWFSTFRDLPRIYEHTSGSMWRRDPHPRVQTDGSDKKAEVERLLLSPEEVRMGRVAAKAFILVARAAAEQPLSTRRQ
jgi:hypothetical protein